MSTDTQTHREIAPEDHTAGSNSEASPIKIDANEANRWLDAVNKAAVHAETQDEIDTLSVPREELRAILTTANTRTEEAHAEHIAHIPLWALRGKTKQGDPDHVPSIDLTARKS